MRAIYRGMSEYGYEMLKDYDMTDEEIKQLRDHEDQECEIEVSIDNGEEFEDNYYYVRFDDGFEVYDLSGIHLEEAK